MRNVGFIGLGNMGSKMSQNLVKAGFCVTGFDISISDNKKKELIHNNILIADDVQQAVKKQNFVITMLPDGSALENVLLPNLKYADKNTYFIDCSTVDLKTTKNIYDILAKNDLNFLDAPVSGGVVGAINSTLTFMVGGKEEVFNSCSSLFKAMGNKSILCGGNGAGQSIKMCNNMILAITMFGVGSSISIAKKLNIDLKKFYDVTSTSSASSWAINNYFPVKQIGPHSPSDNGFESGFSTNLMIKDLSLAISAAEQLGIKIDIGKDILNLYKKISNEGNGNLDFSYIVESL